MATAHLKRDEPSAELLSPSLEALLKALKVCGDNQSELARRCGVKQPHVWKWIKAGRVPTERVHSVSRASGGKVQPHELRPDLPEIFPAPSGIHPAQAA